MAFSLVGSTIEQTGTDADLSGLTGIAGVTTESNGDNRLYILDGVNLRIAGTLSIDPNTEQLYFTDNQPIAYAVRVIFGGDLTIGSNVNNPSFPRGTWLKTTRLATNGFNPAERSFDLNGGTVSFFGGAMDVTAVVNIAAGTFICEKHRVYLRPTLNQRARFRAEIPNTAYPNLEIYFNGINIQSGTAGVTTPNLIIENAQTIAVHPLPDLFELRDYTYIVQGPIYPFSSSGESKTILVKNFDFGSSGGSKSFNFGSPSNAGDLVCVLSKDLSFNFQDTNGNNLENVKLYSIERDNSGTVYPDWDYNNPTDDRNLTLNGTDYSVINETTLISDASGNIQINDFRFGIAYQEGGTGLKTLSRFTKSADENDIQDFLFCAYDKLLSSTDVSLQGTGVTQVNWTLVNDSLITESNKTIVDAYTEIENSNKAYDRIKSYLFNNYAGENQTIVTRNGSILNCRALDVIVDATAAQVVDLTGSTLTIKASDFTNTIQTTGTVTTANGAIVSGGIIDANGDSFLSFVSIDSWEVYASQADANTQTNPLGSGTVLEQYRFNFVPATSYFLRLVVGSETFFRTVTPTQAGETAIDLSSTSLALSQGATLDAIDEQLGFIEKIIYVDTALTTNGDGSNKAPFNNIDSAVALYNTDSYSRIDLKATLMQPAVATVSLAGVTITSSGGNSSLNVNGQSANFAYLGRLNLTGGQSLSDTITTYDTCTFMDSYSGITGELTDCSFLTITGVDQTIGINGSTILRRSIVANAGEVFFNIPDQ